MLDIWGFSKSLSHIVAVVDVSSYLLDIWGFSKSTQLSFPNHLDFCVVGAHFCSVPFVAVVVCLFVFLFVCLFGGFGSRFLAVVVVLVVLVAFYDGVCVCVCVVLHSHATSNMSLVGIFLAFLGFCL